MPPLTQRECVASRADHSGLDSGAAEQRVLVRDAGKRSLRCRVLAAAEVDVVDNSVACGVGILRLDCSLDAGEGTALNQNLSAHAGVDTGIAGVVVGVEDVSCIAC